MGQVPGCCCLSVAPESDLSEAELQELPPFFVEATLELARFRRQLGGIREGGVTIHRKVTAAEFRDGYTDYEYIFLTIVGFARLHMNLEEIVAKNNGQEFMNNPGVQLLESVCGMTMHAEREGANSLLRMAPATLLDALAVAKLGGGLLPFFKGDAFDRTADPCLEGRVGRLMEYLEAQHAALDPSAKLLPPWEDVSLRPLPPGTPLRDVVGEHLRVFVHECIWSWAREERMDYERAKIARQADEACAARFAKLYNAETFEEALVARGVVPTVPLYQWEVQADAGGRWMPYDALNNKKVEDARLRGESRVELRVGPKAWKYEVQLDRMVQVNSKTGAERPLRSRKGTAPPGSATLEDVRAAVRYFVDLDTLPEKPTRE